jgi:ABC-type antimicrobial peptide transport system permease subunit
VLLPGGRIDIAASIPWQVVGLSVVLGVTVAMLAAAYPARLAARLPIVQAVQFE